MNIMRYTVNRTKETRAAHTVSLFVWVSTF